MSRQWLLVAKGKRYAKKRPGTIGKTLRFLKACQKMDMTLLGHISHRSIFYFYWYFLEICVASYVTSAFLHIIK